MTYWLTFKHWRAQFAADVYRRTNFALNTIKATNKPNDKLRYCPTLLASNKKGRPKKDARHKSMFDLIEELGNKKHKKR